MKEINQEACGLDMPNGIHGIRYEQKFVRAPHSQYPSPAPSRGKEVPASDDAMRISLGC